MSVTTATGTNRAGMFQQYVEALVARGDFARFFLEDVVWTTVDTGEVITGREPVADHIVGWHTRIFDAHPDIRAMGTSGEHAFFEADFVGTHIGPLGDLPPTGASVRVPYCVVYDLTPEGISALRFHLSIATLLGQLQAGQG
jgi:hypothetical protein